MNTGSTVPFGNRPNYGHTDHTVVDDSSLLISVKIPRNREELQALLQRFAYLAKSSNETREKHESFIRYLQQKEQDNKDFNFSVGDLKSSYKDVTENERNTIQKAFLVISQRYQKYIEEEETLFQELKKDSFKSQEPLDLDLLQKQVAGLQLLSKDVDLPESLQQEYQDIITPLQDERGYEKKNNIVDEIMGTLLNSEIDFSDFMKKAIALGVESTSDPDSSNPLHAPLGNYYTEKSVASKIANRLQELENLPANIMTFHFDKVHGEGNYDEIKVRALIELKALQQLAKQKQLKRYLIVYKAACSHFEDENLIHFPLIQQTRRSIYIRPKVIQRNPQKLAVQLEEKRKLEANKIRYAQHVEKVSWIIENSENRLNQQSIYFNKLHQITKGASVFHTNTEKDESKKLEKTARQRLQALKANDEEAYIKLLDETKDYRITHLLKQTNSFLDSLAQAVKVQQVEQGADIALENKDEDNADELREKIDYYQVAHRVKEEITEQPKILTGGKLKEYQIRGLQWMVSLYNNKLNGILADEMGLGKTIQSISLITYLIEKKHEEKFLVIVPLSTITNWTLEFEKWAPNVGLVVYKGSPQQRKALQPLVRSGNFHVILTTYEYIIRERPLLCKFSYSHMIIDEGHRMKNTKSKLATTLKQYYRTKNRLILTGTPLQNNLPELWSLLNFVLPKIFNSVKSFDEWFNTPFANTGSQEKIELTEEESLLIIRRLHKVLRPFLLRRLKKDVEKDLPDKVEKVLKCNLSGLQYALYQQMLNHNALFVGGDYSGGKSGIKGLNNKIMQLRKICNHPFVFEEVEAALNTSGLTNDLIWRVSGKFELLDRVLSKFKASGHRVLIFFQMTLVMNIMEDFLRWRDWKYLRLDGATKAEDRQEMLRLFNSEDSGYFCFLLSTRAGGLGLNLQSADTVVIFDTDWNPHQDLQAQDRAHRIGQKNEVRILRLISNESVEEVILERANQKLDIDGKVIQAGKFDNKSTAEEQEAFLKRLLEAEASRDAHEENEVLDDDELNDILARSEDEKNMFTEIDSMRNEFDRIEAKKGVYSTRLIQTEELPSVFLEDVNRVLERKEGELGRTREKKTVKYDDGLTEEQWLMAIDNDNDTVEDAIKRKEKKMSRRKRDHSVQLEEDEDFDEESDFEPANRKRVRRSRSSTPQVNGSSRLDDGYHDVIQDDNVDDQDELNDDAKEQENYSKLISELCLVTSDDDGHKICDAFMTLPSKKMYPDYYQVIKKPVSINQIKKEIRNEHFDSFDSLVDSLRLMCENAKTYNEEGSMVYQDAVAIEDFISSRS